MRWVDCIWLLRYFFLQSKAVECLVSGMFVCACFIFLNLCCRLSVWCSRCFSSSPSCLFHVFVYGFVGSRSCCSALLLFSFGRAFFSFSFSVLFFRRAMPCSTFEWNWFNWTLRSQSDVYTQQRILEFFIQDMERETARTRTELQPLLLYSR